MTIIPIGGYLAVVGLPENKEYWILGNQFAWAHKKDPVDFKESVALPECNWQIEGRLNELSEEQCQEIVKGLNKSSDIPHSFLLKLIRIEVSRTIGQEALTSNPLILKKQ
jgi:hypothetical protein